MLFSHQFDPTALPYYNCKRERRVALISSGNSGVGWYTALHLYLHGYVVYLGGRLKSRCQNLIKLLVQEAAAISAQYSAEERASRSAGELHYLEIDLASLASVVRAVQALRNLEKHLNVLLNNADVLVLPYTETLDGFEVQLQTNYVSPFLLTTKLLPLLERTADLYPNIEAPRVIYISLVAHKLAFRYFGLGLCLNYRPNFIFTWLRYLIAKTAGIHFMRMLALRNPRVLCVSVHPGFIMTTNYFSYWTRLPIIGVVFWFFFEIFGFLFGVTVEQGSHALVKYSLDTLLTPEQDNGSHFAYMEKAEPSRIARNMDYAARSWIWTVHQLGKRHIDIV